MTPADYRLLVESIQGHEGLSLHPIADAKGSLEIGHGRNLTFTGISRTEAAYLLDNDLADRFATVPIAWKPFASCDPAAQRVVIEMAYQLGTDGLLLFKKFLHALAVGDHQQAAQELRASQLAIQTPARTKDYEETLTT